MALSAGTKPGFSLMKAKRTYFPDAMKFKLVSVPLTWCHKVGIVAGYSNNEMVNPILAQHILSSFLMNGEDLTIDFLLILHQQKRVIVDVTEKFNIRSTENMINPCDRLRRQRLLHPPVISVFLEEFLPVKELREVRHV